MFENLSTALQKTFKNLRGYGKLSEKNVKDALREVRLALLEADVNFKVARDFVKRVQESCMGEDVLNSVTPGQQVVKRVNDELVELFGGAHKEFDLAGKPASVMLMGLHGSGKTTTAGKLANRWKRSGRRVLLVACDIRRPAAVEQLSILAGQVGCDIVKPEPGETVPALGKRAAQLSCEGKYDVVIYDTGGRFQVDDELVHELKEFSAETEPKNTVLVLDAAIGQESVNVAEAFRDAVGLTGLILTKLDGDARGGAALSVHAVTGCPILMTGSGEKMEDLDPFYPDRMASRILGMGDVISFVEKAQGVVDQDEAMKMQEKLMNNQLDLQDFLGQIQQMKKLGPISNLFDMMPGNAMKLDGKQKEAMATASELEMKKFESIIQSMTPHERRHPKEIDRSRRLRIAAGCGRKLADVNQLLKRFEQMGKMSKQVKKMGKRLRHLKKFTTK
ncbi:signal recognition particle protein [Pontiella sulfatireligans]|uniref:Signal recognition particle protein n=1 Tax=Pontiella sulfatireligans TaxID=2750658 RepID=A0A6C2UEX3_9BACT|nr:signal recognition particle protein [Pontiella sulfatireligans]VGO18469.1 Signal recognition particle protein [Pontiella sulfatireligans]